MPFSIDPHGVVSLNDPACGSVTVYPSRAALMAALFPRGFSWWHDHHAVFRTTRIYNEHGQALTWADFSDLARPRSPRARPSAPPGMPVPGTGHRSRYSTYLRHPRTMPERRANAWWDEDAGEPAPRSRRRPHALPNDYDDLIRHRDRCWKSFRRAQHKTNGEGGR